MSDGVNGHMLMYVYVYGQISDAADALDDADVVDDADALMLLIQ